MNFTKIAKPLTLLTHHKAKFKGTPAHHTAFVTLKEASIQAPILCYPDPAKKYIVYMDASENSCGAQLSQKHNGTEFPVAFLSHNFSETHRKWSTHEQKAYVVYYAITKWNYYLQGSGIIVHNDHKPFAKFCNGKNANNKINRWDWNLQPTISCLNGCQEQDTKPPTASPDWSNYQTILKPQSWCSLPPIWKGQHSIHEVKHHNNAKQQRTQDLQTPHLSQILLHLI